MPKLKEQTQLALIDKAVQVYSLIAGGSSAKAALATVGITREQYNRWLSEADEAIVGLQTILREQERVKLAMILESDLKVLENVIKDGVSSVTMPLDRIAIATYLDNQREKLADRHRAVASEQVQKLLVGPSLAKASSRFVAGYDDASPPIMVDVTVNVHQPDIIDLTAKEVPSEN